jgi:hypothetical protein
MALRNQSPALESLKDQLGFLVTKILGGDSFIQKKDPEINRGSPRFAARVRQCFFKNNIINNIIEIIMIIIIASKLTYHPLRLLMVDYKLLYKSTTLLILDI